MTDLTNKKTASYYRQFSANIKSRGKQNWFLKTFNFSFYYSRKAFNAISNYSKLH